MENSAYKNHDNEINELINLLFENKVQIILYNSHEGYGDTAFVQRVMFLLHTTEKFQIFHAELSPSVQNPLHEVIKNIVCKKGKLYHRLQLFSDEQNYRQDIPILLTSIIKDLTRSETLAALFSHEESIPIYAGFYQDRLKQIFFDLIHFITKQQRLFFFIDNIQYMDNDSFYELQALLQNPNITLVLFKSGNGIFFDKFYDETKYKFHETELNFPEPDISYVQKLATLYHKTLSEYEAASLLSENKRNVRKILCNIRKPQNVNSNLILEDQILKIITLYDDYITTRQISKIFEYTPYAGIITVDEINNCIKNIESKGLLQSVAIFETHQIQYKTVQNINISIDIADKVIINRALSEYYNHCRELNYKHMCQAWALNVSLKFDNRNNELTKKILLYALKMGYKVSDEIVQYAKKQNDITTQILSATFLFCNANYLQAKTLLEGILPHYMHRSLDVMYAISLSRCRNHQLAEIKLSNLINSSDSLDEKTILVTFLISNHVHSRKISDAKLLYNKYSKELEPSSKYPYFLRNSATLFDKSTAYTLRSTALNLFDKSNDYFGYYSTIINMTSYFLKHKPIEYTISIIQKAFDELQQYNASQIHLAANNLGVCYLFAKDNINALKYLMLCFENARTIMPRGYAAINIASIYLQNNQYAIAHKYLNLVSEEVYKSQLARLKAHFYLQCALAEYVSGNLPQVNAAIVNARKYCSPTENQTSYIAMNIIKNNIENNIIFNDKMFSDMFVPCFLEYWTINSIDVLSKDFLPM